MQQDPQLRAPSGRAYKRTSNTTLRILIVTNMYPTIERPEFGIFVREQVEALRDLPGLTVDVWPFAGGGLHYLRAAAQLKAHLRQHSYDVIHAHYGLSGWTTKLAKRRTPMLVTFHGTDVHHPLVGQLSKVLGKVVELAAVVSPSLSHTLKRVPDRNVPVFVLPTGVDMARFQPLPKRDSRDRLGISSDRKYLLFPADPSRVVKRYDRAQALVDRLEGVELLVMQGVPADDVPLWINAADAVLVTSEYEGFGLAICEALACNVPVLSTPVGIAPLVLSSLDGTHCAPFEVDDWTTALQCCLKNDDFRVLGRQRAQFFDRRRMAERVLCAYREIAATAA